MSHYQTFKCLPLLHFPSIITKTDIEKAREFKREYKEWEGQKIMERKDGTSLFNSSLWWKAGQRDSGRVVARTVYSDSHLRNRCHALWDTECVCTRVWSSTIPHWPWTFSTLNGPGASAGWILTSTLRGDVDQHASSWQPKLPYLPCSTCEWHWQIYSWLGVYSCQCLLLKIITKPYIIIFNADSNTRRANCRRATLRRRSTQCLPQKTSFHL